MTETSMPPVPAWLAHLPTVGGLVVPWITPHTTDGRYLLGVVDADLVRDALLRRSCGVCGRPLEARMVLLMRLSDLPRRCSHEPAMHPQCAAYTAVACPMISGRLARYRSTPRQLDATMLSAPDAAARQGARAEPWFAVWLRGYRVINDHGNPAAAYVGTELLRVRPIAWRLLFA